MPTNATELLTPSATTNQGRDWSLDYLRTTITLLVLAHHSMLAYTTWAHFDPVQPLRSTAPVVDSARWAGFDYLVQYNDAFFMSLMFFLSGLFVYPALRRQGIRGFLRDRALRLGLPFGVAVVGLMPVAYYASWQLAGRTEGFGSYYRALAAQGFMVGPPWFLWVLLLFNLLVAVVVSPLSGLAAAGRWLSNLSQHTDAAVASIFLLALAAYWPALVHYGSDTWTVLGTAPFAFQASRLGLYALWFALGFLLGIAGPATGLLAPTGSLARHWPWWVGGSGLAYGALWLGPSLLGPEQPLLSALLWVGCCVAGCLGWLALFRGTAPKPRPWLNTLSRYAYVLYLVHYVYLTWLQWLLVSFPWAATLKFGCVFGGTLAASWLTARLLLRVPLLSRIL